MSELASPTLPNQSEGTDGPSLENVSRHVSVLVWDPNLSRLEAVTQILGKEGMRTLAINRDVRFRATRAPGKCVAVVALGRSEHDESSVSVIRTLTAKGLRVICYGDSIFSLPISLRCDALLSGASLLFDSLSQSFAVELTSAVAEIIETEAREHFEAKNLKRTMRGLGIIGEGAAMMSVFRRIVRISAVSDFAVLISGETGTGKELVAKALHKLDPKRRNRPLVVVNCGAIAAGLAESEFFGHRRGAFTGADAQRKGLFRSADGGVLFLDEIGELNDSLQAKLLRVLQEKSILGVGFDHEIRVDVRVIAATNRNIETMVQQGTFRQDLYHRLNILSVDMPPLRDRTDDLQPLIEHFVKKYGSLGRKGRTEVSSDFVEALTQLRLPGNVRQLENVVRHALLNKLAQSPLSMSDLPPLLLKQLTEATRKTEESMPTPPTDSSGEPPFESGADFLDILQRHNWNLLKSLQFCEKSLLRCALQSAQGNQSQTARLVGITPRSVYNKIQKYSLSH